MSIWQFDFIPFGFSKNDLPKETAKPSYLWLFQKIWRSSPSVLAIFVIFWRVGRRGRGSGYWYFVVKKNISISTPVYNIWYQQTVSFNLLEIGCLIIIFISVLDSFFLTNGEAWNREWITWNCCRLISLKWVDSLTDCSYGKSNN